MTITIDKNVPAPIGRRANAKYPWDDMEPGDSFFIPGRMTSQIGGSITQVKKKHPGWEMTGRTIVENDVRGLRVWRIA